MAVTVLYFNTCEENGGRRICGEEQYKILPNENELQAAVTEKYIHTHTQT